MDENRTMIFYESPYRLIKTLGDLEGYFGAGREASVSRELTKIYEETVRGDLIFLKQHFTSHPPKGEIVIVVAGKNLKGKAENEENTDDE